MIVANENAETSLPGLFAAGDEAFGDISAAGTFGYIGGERAAEYARAVRSIDTNALTAAIDEKNRQLDAEQFPNLRGALLCDQTALAQLLFFNDPVYLRAFEYLIPARLHQSRDQHIGHPLAHWLARPPSDAMIGFVLKIKNGNALFQLYLRPMNTGQRKKDTQNQNG